MGYAEQQLDACVFVPFDWAAMGGVTERAPPLDGADVCCI